MKNHTKAFYEAFGERVRSYRSAGGMTQEELAAKVGLSRTSITNIEKGNQQVLLHQLQIFSEALAVRVEQLLPERRTMSSEAAEKLISSEEVGEDLRIFLKSIVS